LVNPYEEYLTGDAVIRTFYENVKPDELVWHRDKNDRMVEVISGDGWKLQMDNKVPQELNLGVQYYIKQMEYHRLIKGKGTLRLKIWENKNDKI